jgi:hypothetical protein
MELSLPEGSCDVAFSNWLLMYLGDAEVAQLARNMLGWVRLGAGLLLAMGVVLGGLGALWMCCWGGAAGAQHAGMGACLSVGVVATVPMLAVELLLGGFDGCCSCQLASAAGAARMRKSACDGVGCGAEPHILPCFPVLKSLSAGG